MAKLWGGRFDGKNEGNEDSQFFRCGFHYCIIRKILLRF